MSDGVERKDQEQEPTQVLGVIDEPESEPEKKPESKEKRSVSAAQRWSQLSFAFV